MFYRNKFFIFIFLCIISYILYLIYKPVDTVSEKSTLNSKQEQAWFKKYPQLGRIESQESATLKQELTKPVTESLASLSGTITNSLGIRDDILDFIIKTVPESNTLAMRAVIKFAQQQQLIYYGNLTQQQVLDVANKQMLVLECLMKYLSGNQGLLAMREIDKLMRNTPQRDKWLWYVDRHVFGWRVIGSGLSAGDEDAACKNGEF